MKKKIYISIALIVVNCIIRAPIPLQALGQERDDAKKGCKCDFSKYNPLILSHPLVDAAIKTIEPEYPLTAKRANIQGKVEVRILVDRNGNVVEACVVEGHPLLRLAAKSAALQWKFKKN